jgi:hypothetical protein
MKTACVAGVLPRFHTPAAGSSRITLMQKLIGPCPNQLRAGLHPNVGHHAEIKSTKLMQSLPFLHQRIISIHKERVIELLTQLLFEWPQAGEINDKAARIKLSGREMKQETTAVAVHESAMTAVSPLTMATGVALE